MKKKIPALACLLAALLAVLPPGPAPVAAAKRSKAAEQIAFGVDMARRGLWREALFRFLEAERLDPGSPRVLCNVAVAYEAVGDFEKALEYYQRAVKADSASREIKTNYARFAEFYQSFKGKEAAPKPSATEDAAPPPADDTAPPPPPPAPPPPATPADTEPPQRRSP
jgi:Tfp pilus assembly protein PilF